ncbi:MAG: hypothetical protein WC878_02970 [Candidatus Paceibacterota bacterium]|jgi:hypothetical protein
MEQSLEKIKRVERLTEMPEEWRVLREKILNNFESKTEGLDIERVCEFMFSHNLPVTDFLFFDKEDIPQLQRWLGKVYNMDNFIPDHTGSYVQAVHFFIMNLVLVLRQRQTEEENGSVYTEGQLIHELAHGSSEHQLFVNTPDSGKLQPRSGFGLSNNKKREGFSYGTFLEEGFADMLCGDYMKKNILSEVKKKIFKKLESLGFDTRLESISLSSVKADCGIKYIDLRDGELHYGETSIAATGLDMLCAKQPKLKQVLFEARSDIEKLREVPKLINKIKPGLYMEIQKHALYTKEDFIRVQNIIKDAIKNSV